jgi:hypothetical protein
MPYITRSNGPSECVPTSRQNWFQRPVETRSNGPSERVPTDRQNGFQRPVRTRSNGPSVGKTHMRFREYHMRLGNNIWDWVITYVYVVDICYYPISYEFYLPTGSWNAFWRAVRTRSNGPSEPKLLQSQKFNNIE